MGIYEAAVELGNLIKESDEGKALEAAQENWSACEELRTAYTEYMTQRKLLEMQESGEGEGDPALVARISERANELYNFISNHEIYKELDKAQNDLDTLIRNVYGIMVEQVTGQNPNCTHDCSTCGGC